jgi:hypothetical protein
MGVARPIGDNSPVSLDWKSGPLAEGLVCFRNAEFFLAHEHWESAWLTLEGPEKTFLQAMIQVTVALHHHQSGNRAGALSLLTRALHKLDTFPPSFGGIALAPFRADLHPWLHAIESGGTSTPLPIPSITLAEHRPV